MAPVPCSATEIEQVVLNLLRNAAQAMSEGQEHDQPPCITLHLRRECEFAVIEVVGEGVAVADGARRGFLQGFGIEEDDPAIVAMADSEGDRELGGARMANIAASAFPAQRVSSP